MEKTKRKILFAILSFLFISIFTFALVEVLPTSASATTYTDEEQTNGLKIGVSDGGLWTVEDAPGKQKKYTAVKNNKTTPSLKFTIEGEQYFSFEYHFTANSYASSATNYFTVDIDDVQQCKVSNTGAENTAQEYIMKTRGAGTHTVVLWANGAKNSTEKKQVEMYFQNFRLRDEGEFIKHNLTMDYNEKFLATYIVEGANGGWDGAKTTEEQIKAAATYLEPGKEYSLPEGMSFCFISFSKTYVSSISGEEIRSHMLSNHIQSADGKKKITSSGGGPGVRVTGCKITNTGIRQAMNAHADTSGTSYECEGYALKDITCEYAPQPQVSYAEYVDGVEVPHKLDWNETVVLPNGQTTLPIRIRSTFKDFDKFYKVKVNGVETEVEWERKDETTIASAITVEQRSTVLVSGWFGEQYIYQEKGATSGKLGTEYLSKGELKEGDVDQKLSVQFNIDVLTENGVKDVLADAKAENILEVVQDEAYPWYYDAARSDEGMAFTSGLSGASAQAQKISQLGFKVKGSGVLIFEFQIDGTGDITDSKTSWAAYNLDTKVSASSWAFGSFTTSTYLSKDFHPCFGFKNTLATSIAYGLSSNNAYNLVHRPSNPVHANWTDPADSTQKNDKTTSNEKYWTNFEDTRKLHSTQLIATTADSEWYRVTIPIKDKQDADETMIYLAHAVYAVSSNYTVKNGYSGERMTIRNVGFYPNNTTVSFAVENGEGTSASNGTISVKADGKDITLKDGMPDDSTPLSLGARLTLTATPTKGNFFYGWQEVIGEKKRIFSYDKETSYSVMAAEVQIVALIAKEGTFAVRNGGKFYKTSNVQAAFDAARDGEDKTVIAVDNVTLTGELTVPADVNFIIPYNTKGGITEEGNSKNATNRVSWWEKGKYKDPVYKVTLGEGATLTVNGNFYVGGVLHYPDQSAQGHTSGAYSEFVNDGTVTVADGGVTDVCGRVTGKGSIDVQNGGKLYQPFMILDYSGGTNTEAMFDTAHVTPFKMYSMVNIQCTGGFTIHFGAVLYGHASLYFYSSITKLDQPFVTYKGAKDAKGADETSLIILEKEGASAKFVYDDTHARPDMGSANNAQDVGKTTVTLTGGATAGYMDFVSFVQTNGVFFSIPYNFALILQTGDYTMPYPYKLMPGASLTVEEDATLTVCSPADEEHPNGLHVYDSFYGPAFAKREYPTGEQLKKANYNPYASLIVNGTMTIKKNATFVGTVQTENTKGKIVIEAGAKLSASLHDGVATQYGCNYTKYTLKAQVYDRVHNKLGDLTAGHTYHSTYQEGVNFTLPGIKFEYESKTSHTSGAHSLQSLTTAEATGLVGSWMIEHEDDVYDWTPKADDRLPEGTLYKKITRICTALGCDHEAEKYLFSVPDSLGSIPFRNAAFASEDLELLFKNCFTKNAPDTFPADVTVKASELGGDTKVGEYTVTVSLNDKGVWLDGDRYISTKQLKWSIAQLSLENGVGTATPSQSTTEYNGVKTEKLGVTVKAKGIAGDLKATTDYTVSYDGQDTTNVGTVIVTVTGTGNYTGTITCTYQITAKKVNLTLEKQTATYSGAKPEINGTKYKTTDILAGDEDNVAITLDITPKGDVWNVGSYDLTAKLSNTGGHENYVLGTVDGKNMFEITKAAVTVTVTAQHTTYNGKEQSFSGTWEAEGLVHEEQKSVLGVNLSAAGTAAKAYDVTASYNERGNYTVKFVGCDGAFVIDALDISTGADIKAAACTYNGQAQEPTLTVTKDGLTLQLTTDYTAKYSNNTNAGAADVTVTATGNFKGTATTTFEIQKASVTVRAEDAHTAEGDELAADFDFTATSGTIYNDDKAVLKEFFKFTTGATKENAKAGQSFEITIEFKSEARPGNYEVTFDETKGVYYIDESVYKNVTYEDLTLTYNGQKQIFKVVTADLPGARVTLKPEGREEEFTGATDAKQYRIDVTISLEGHNDYKTTVTFEIKAKNIEGADIALAEADLTYTGEEIRPDVTKVSVGDLELKSGEYSVSYGSNTNAGEAMVTVTANQGNFTGTATTTFMIAARSIKGAAVTIAGSFTYNGREQTPDVTVTLQIGEKSVTLGKDDFVVKYENNRHAGAASVTVTGKGNYSESVENAQAFTIAAKPIAVTIREQQTVYTGKAPELQQNGDRWFTTSDAICEDDDLQITLKALAKGDKWGAGTYEIDGECANRDYAVTFTKGTLTIEKKAITVTITDKSSEYGAEYAELAWTVDEQALCTGDTRETLGITLAIKDKTDRLPAGAYKIEATTTAADYAVTFAGSWKAQAGEVAGGTYTVKKKAITITLQAQSSVYNNAVPAVGQAKDTAWKVTVGEILSGDELSVQLYLEAPGKDVKADGYTIKGRYSNDNYDVTFVDGTYTITARPVTVKIADQEAVYDYEHKYAFNNDAWTLEGALAESEEKGVLNVALTKPELTDVGEYEIAGTWNNKNYAVTFAGTKGHAGVYTVKQKDVGDGTEDEAVFLLVVGEGGNTSEGERKLRVQMSGDSLHVVCTVTVYEGTDEKTLACKIDPAELKALGEQTVTVTIEDKNYKGSAVFTVVVTDAEGYTPEMREKLQQLETLAAGMDAEALKAEDFPKLKEINALLTALSEEEREALGESLEPYDELVAAWHELADLDEIIETAEAIGNAPIRGLYEAAAAVSALAVLGYIVMKGGLL